MWGRLVKLGWLSPALLVAYMACSMGYSWRVSCGLFLLWIFQASSSCESRSRGDHQGSDAVGCSGTGQLPPARVPTLPGAKGKHMVGLHCPLKQTKNHLFQSQLQIMAFYTPTNFEEGERTEVHGLILLKKNASGARSASFVPT